MRTLLALTAALVLGLTASADEANKPAPGKVGPALNFKMKDIDGKEVPLSRYQGKVILLVNVASKCGLTPQYEQLQALHDKYAKQGLVIIGVPANEFGMQEPGTLAEIKTFCTKEYGVKFPIMAKSVVKGKEICPLYDFLTSRTTNPKFAGDIKWNFTKFLINRKGEVVNRFEPRVKPDAKEVVESIETELKK